MNDIDDYPRNDATEAWPAAEDDYDAYCRAGIAWWNGLPEPMRRIAIEAAGPNATVADAYRLFLERCPTPDT